MNIEVGEDGTGYAPKAERYYAYDSDT